MAVLRRVLFGAFDQLSVWGKVAAIPVFAWEVTLALRMVTKGFNPASDVAIQTTGSDNDVALAAA